MMNWKTLRGFTLIELMIGMVVGLVVIGGVTTVYISTLSSSSENLKYSKLNQELNSMMSVMSNDIMRAGIWGNMLAVNYSSPQTNPFSQFGDTTLEVRNTVAGNTKVADNSSSGGSCVLYSYDADLDGILDNADIRGFRLNSNAVEIRQSGTASETTHNSCNDTTNDTWLPATDGRLINITTLTFSLGQSECINTREPNGADDDSDGSTNDAAEMDCYDAAQTPTANSGDITTETRQVDILLTGQLVNDSSITASITQSVRVRNDLVRIR